MSKEKLRSEPRRGIKAAARTAEPTQAALQRSGQQGLPSSENYIRISYK